MPSISQYVPIVQKKETEAQRKEPAEGQPASKWPSQDSDLGCRIPEPLDLAPICPSPSGTHSHTGLQPVGISHLQSPRRRAERWPGQREPLSH